MAKGTKVVIAPKAYPFERWDGVILRKTKYGFSVQYECHGMRLKETFSASELQAA